MRSLVLRALWLVLPDSIQAVTFGRVSVRPGVVLCPAVWEHEKVHLRQQEAMGRWRWLWRYLTNRAFRLAQEVDGYRMQLRHGGSLDHCVRMLASAYGLGLTEAEARQLLAGGPFPLSGAVAR